MPQEKELQIGCPVHGSNGCPPDCARNQESQAIKWLEENRERIPPAVFQVLSGKLDLISEPKVENKQGGGEQKEKEEWEVLYEKWRGLILDFDGVVKKIEALTEKSEDPELSRIWRVIDFSSERENVDSLVKYSDHEGTRQWLRSIMEDEKELEEVCMSDLTKERLLTIASRYWSPFQKMFRAEAILASYYKDSDNPGVTTVKELISQTTRQLRVFFEGLGAVPEDQLVLLVPIEQVDAVVSKRCYIDRHALELTALREELVDKVAKVKARKLDSVVLSDVMWWGLRKKDGTVMHENRCAVKGLKA